MSSWKVRRCVSLFGMKFDLWKKSREERNSERRSATSATPRTRRCQKSTAKGGNQTERHTPELQRRFGERTGAEDFGEMCH